MALSALYLQASGGDAAITESAQDFRQLVGAVLSEGIVTTGALLVAQRAAGANFTVDVAAGQAMVLGESVAQQGGYLITSTAVGSVTIPAAPASGSRTHRIILRQWDKTHDGGTLYTPVLECLPDTGSGTPALPANAITLALVGPVVLGTASITNSLIVDQRAPVAAPGGKLLCTSTTRPAHVAGRTIYETDTKYTLTSDGALWRRTVTSADTAVGSAMRMASGTSTVTFTASTAGSLAVTLPAGLFVATPNVVATVRSAAGLAVGSTILITAASATSFTVQVNLLASQTTTLSVYWVAVEAS